MTVSLVPGLNPASSLPYRRLTFVPAQRADAHAIVSNFDLIPLNKPAEPEQEPGNMPSAPQQQRSLRPLFDEAKLPLKWSSILRPGVGYVNQGNTCFMNSVLQCLTHTPPLAELCLSEQRLLPVQHPSDPQNHPVLITRAHIRQAFSSNHPFRPVPHARTLKVINRRFRLGRQEDAHEYLRCMVDAMHEACLRPVKDKVPKELANTTFVHRIFGGRLRSQIKCEGVKYTSNTYDPFLDLSLEIARASTLQRALSDFTAPEVLDGENRYRCPKNKQLVRALKRITIEDAPNVLTIHLKRFDFLRQGRKLSKKVDFSFELDLAPYMSSPHVGGPHVYDLYAVLVHHGHSIHSGHYVCYVRAGNGLWYLCDDQRVAQCGQRAVEGQQAYILFYIRRNPKLLSAAAVPRGAAAAGSTVVQQQQQQQQQATRSAVASVGGVSQAAAGQALPQQQQPRQKEQQQQETADGLAAAGAVPSGVSAAPLDSTGPPATSSTESTANAEGGEGPKRRRGVPLTFLDGMSLAPLQRHLREVNQLSNKRGKQQQQRHQQQHSQLQGILQQLGAALGQGQGVQLQATSSSPPMHHRRHQLHTAGAGSPVRSPKRLRRHAAAAAGGAGAGAALLEQQEGPAPKKQKLGLGVAAAPQPRRVVPVAVEPEQQPAEQQRPQKHHHHHKHHHDHHQQQQHNAAGDTAPAAAAADGVAGGGDKPSRASQPAKAVQAGQQPQQAAARGKDSLPVQVGSKVMGASALELLNRDSRTAAWEGAEQLQQAKAALERASKPKRQQREEWDVEYDRGKQKKVKQDRQTAVQEAADRGGNVFQEAWDADLPAKARKEAMQGGGSERGGWGGFGRGRGRDDRHHSPRGGYHQRGGRHDSRGGGRHGGRHHMRGRGGPPRGRGGGRGGRGGRS